MRVKKPRLTSPHSGVRNSSTRPPETVSARTSAVTPAGPDMARAYRGTNASRCDGTATPSLRTVGTPVGWTAMDDWRSYDSVAETYARIHAPRLAEPARDLVELTGIEAGWRVLDVGTGTGVAAFAAAGTGANVVGIDEAPGMLRVARSANGSFPVATAIAIDLPFRDGAFDALLANFVLAHFTKYKTALFDMKRVLRPGGRLGLTAWADAEDDLARTWLELVGTVVPPEVLQAAMDERLPWRERLRRR